MARSLGSFSTPFARVVQAALAARKKGSRFATADVTSDLTAPELHVIALGREKQDAMNIRVRQLWAPVLSTFLISVAVQFVALRVPQLPPWVLFTRNGVSIVLAPLWMLALPFIGALGAWLSLRGGGNTRDRLLTALGSAWLRSHHDAGSSAVDDHRTPLLAEHQADHLHRVHDRLVPGPGGLADAGGLPWLGRKAT